MIIDIHLAKHAKQKGFVLGSQNVYAEATVDNCDIDEKYAFHKGDVKLMALFYSNCFENGSTHDHFEAPEYQELLDWLFQFENHKTFLDEVQWLEDWYNIWKGKRPLFYEVQTRLLNFFRNNNLHLQIIPSSEYNRNKDLITYYGYKILAPNSRGMLQTRKNNKRSVGKNYDTVKQEAMIEMFKIIKRLYKNGK